MPPASPRPPKHAVHDRDAGLRRISGATRILVTVSVAAAGLFAALAAWAQPGRSKTPATGLAARSTAPSVPTTAPQPVASADDGGDEELAPPATVPATIPAQTPVQTPDTQFSPPSYQYSPPPVVSHAS